MKCIKLLKRKDRSFDEIYVKGNLQKKRKLEDNSDKKWYTIFERISKKNVLNSLFKTPRTSLQSLSLVSKTNSMKVHGNRVKERRTKFLNELRGNEEYDFYKVKKSVQLTKEQVSKVNVCRLMFCKEETNDEEYETLLNNEEDENHEDYYQNSYQYVL